MNKIKKYSFIIILLLLFCIFLPKSISYIKSEINNNQTAQNTDMEIEDDIINSKTETSDDMSINKDTADTSANKDTNNTTVNNDTVNASVNNDTDNNTTVNKDTDDNNLSIATHDKDSQVNINNHDSQIDVPQDTYFEPEIGNFHEGDESYFDDALFIGDSRAVDIRDYGCLKNADYFTNVGMSIYNIKKNPININGEKTYFETFIHNKQYKKIYIILGLNEVGYNKQKTVNRYKQFIDELFDIQPDCIIFINANLLVTEHCSKTDKYSHNKDIIQLNNMLAHLADGEKIFYIDVNTVFGDGSGNLQPQFTGDGTHIYAKYVSMWCDWLKKRII